jgi:hypothetical protein
VHHVVSTKQGGTENLTNLRLVHHMCHRRFTAAERLLGYVDCLSRVQGDPYARICGEGDTKSYE